MHDGSSFRSKPAVVVIVIASAMLVAYPIWIMAINALAKEELVREYPQSKAIDRVAAIPGDRTTAALTNVALSRDTLEGNSERAVRVLSSRCDSQVGSRLARLLVPDVDLALREAAAEALSKCDCTFDCIELVANYLERRFWGEKTYGENLDESIVDPSEEHLERQLRALLSQHPTDLHRLLAARYGIHKNSWAPSPFAIRLITQLHLADYCQELGGALKALEDNRAKNSHILSTLSSAVHDLHCSAT
jgi:hypothetical protein